jgi:hypothetical protein
VNRSRHAVQVAAQQRDVAVRQRRLGPAANRAADRSRRERRSVVHPVADHQDTAGPQGLGAERSDLAGRAQGRLHITDAELGADCGHCGLAVPAEDRRPHTHLVKAADTRPGFRAKRGGDRDRPQHVAAALDQHDCLAPRMAGRDRRRKRFWQAGLFEAGHPHWQSADHSCHAHAGDDPDI